jgi:hypothetical protein
MEPASKHCATILDEFGRILGEFQLMALGALCQSPPSPFTITRLFQTQRAAQILRLMGRRIN